MKNKWAIKRCSPEEGHNFLQPSSNLLPASSTHFAPFLPQMWAVKSGGFKIHRTHISTKLFANFWEVRTLNLQRLPEQVNNEIYQCRQNFPEKRKSLQEKTMTMMVDNTIITTTEEWPKSHLSVSQSVNQVDSSITSRSKSATLQLKKGLGSFAHSFIQFKYMIMIISSSKGWHEHSNTCKSNDMHTANRSRTAVVCLQDGLLWHSLLLLLLLLLPLPGNFVVITMI